MVADISSSVAKVLKAGLDVQSLALQNAQLQQTLANFGQKGFADFLNGQIQGFISQAYMVEKKVKGYTLGEESIEQVAPLVSEFGLEVEAKTKIIDALSNVLKTLTQIQM